MKDDCGISPCRSFLDLQSELSALKGKVYALENDESGWVIERLDADGNSRSMAIAVCGDRWRWDIFHSAMRFARKEDAEACGKALKLTEDQKWVATEHSWSM